MEEKCQPWLERSEGADTKRSRKSCTWIWSFKVAIAIIFGCVNFNGLASINGDDQKSERNGKSGTKNATIAFRGIVSSAPPLRCTTSFRGASKLTENAWDANVDTEDIFCHMGNSLSVSLSRSFLAHSPLFSQAKHFLPSYSNAKCVVRVAMKEQRNSIKLYYQKIPFIACPIFFRIGITNRRD